MKKRILKFTAIVLFLALLTGCTGGSAKPAETAKTADKPFAGQTLRIYNWGEYTGEDTLQNFEKLTGAKVVQDNFDSNEQMYIKVANGDAYDILVPSDYMIERLIQEDRIVPLDQSRIHCMDLIADECKDLQYDPGNKYSVPYFWGNVGIVYNTAKVDEADLEKEGFGIFLNQKYKGDIYLYDSERDAFMMALKYLGYSMNTSDEKELQEAYEFLLEVVNTMKPEIVMDEIIDNMAQGRKAFGLIYSGDATYVMDENEDMGYYVPESGTNVWCDAMVIPKNAENPDLAYEFINYVTGYEPAMDNSVTVGYTSPNKEVAGELSGPGGQFEGINAYIPEKGENDEVFRYNEDQRKIVSELWSKVKIAASNAG